MYALGGNCMTTRLKSRGAIGVLAAVALVLSAPCTLGQIALGQIALGQASPDEAAPNQALPQDFLLDQFLPVEVSAGGSPLGQVTLDPAVGDGPSDEGSLDRVALPKPGSGPISLRQTAVSQVSLGRIPLNRLAMEQIKFDGGTTVERVSYQIVAPTPSGAPDATAPFRQAQLLGDDKKYQLCREDLDQIKGNAAATHMEVAEPDWMALAERAKALGVEAAFQDAARVFMANRSVLGRKDAFAIATYSKTAFNKRKIILFELAGSRVQSFAIEHGPGDFDNSGHYRSSLGCFVAGASVKNYAFSLHGFDGELNSKACERRLQVHISHLSEPGPSNGCLTVPHSNSVESREK